MFSGHKSKAIQSGIAAKREVPQEVFMNSIRDTHPIRESAVRVAPKGINSLVRGAETSLLDQLMPLVRREPVWLDLGCVERIDAAGIAALITLYRTAHEAGRCFGVINPTPHVREILTLVGLSRFLLSDDLEREGCLEMAESAA